MYEKEDLVDQLLEHNSARRKRQKKLDIRVIMGNPPYSAGQENANDNNQNIDYPNLDSRIRSTYAERSTATNKNALYDSYIRAIRWASDRIGSSGVIGFVTNAGWVEANTGDGLRKCLADEFSTLYVFHLRGNARTSGELRRKEKDNVFGMGSRAPIAISLLVKNPTAKEHGKIHFHDIGDYLGREEKLEKIESYASIAGITKAGGWQPVIPDAHGDWLKQRDDSFNDFMALGDKTGKGVTTLLSNFSRGLETGRDAWCYNSSQKAVMDNMVSMITFYNSEVQRFNAARTGLDKKAREEAVDSFINTNPAQISWTSSLKQELVRDKLFSYKADSLAYSLYRPFTKQWCYYNGTFNHRVGQMPRIFPNMAVENRVICVSGIGARSGFSALMADTLPCLDNIEKGQCFPLYLYEPVVPAQAGTQATLDLAEAKPLDSRLRGNDGNGRGRGNDGDVRGDGEYVHGNDGYMRGNDGYARRDAITDEGLAHFQSAYPGEAISKEDVFYYVYGLLHSKDYRERYADNLSKELPRIPRVKTAAGFRTF